MPTYEYECETCHQSFEVRQRISEPPLTRCAHCGGPARRVLSAATFILKGAGFYVNDYPSEARKKALTEEKKSSGESAPSASSTSSSTTPSTSPSTSDS